MCGRRLHGVANCTFDLSVEVNAADCSVPDREYLVAIGVVDNQRSSPCFVGCGDHGRIALAVEDRQSFAGYDIDSLTRHHPNDQRPTDYPYRFHFALAFNAANIHSMRAVASLD